MSANLGPTDGEYAQYVNYDILQPFKDRMVEVAHETAGYSLERRDVRLRPGHRVGGWHYAGVHDYVFAGPLLEGLGNKSWLARWMQMKGDKKSHMDTIAQDLALMSVNDNLPALPFIYHNEITPRASEYFLNEDICDDYARGTLAICDACGMTLGGGETPNYWFLVGASGDVDDAPVMSSATVGIITNPDLNLITADRLKPGLAILAVEASGVHSNGLSLIIGRGLKLPEQFMTMLPDGRTYGEHALLPTMNYVPLIEAIQQNDIELACVLPGTGDGVAKMAADKRELTYHISDWWAELPPLMLYLWKELGVSLEDMLTTFNMGSGLYLMVRPELVDQIIRVGQQVGFRIIQVGETIEGPRHTVISSGLFGHMGSIALPPPGCKAA